MENNLKLSSIQMNNLLKRTPKIPLYLNWVNFLLITHLFQFHLSINRSNAENGQDLSWKELPISSICLRVFGKSSEKNCRIFQGPKNHINQSSGCASLQSRGVQDRLVDVFLIGDSRDSLNILHFSPEFHYDEHLILKLKSWAPKNWAAL